MRLAKVQSALREKAYSFDYEEEEGIGSIDFEDRGLEYHVWEFQDDDGSFGAETNLMHAGHMEELRGDYEEQLLRLLEPFENRKTGWPSAVIFDMDGLMFQTEQQIQRAWDIVGPSFCGEPMGYHLKNTMGMNRTSRMEYFYKACGAEFPFEKFEQCYRAEVEKMKQAEGIPVQKGLFELMGFLHEKQVPMILATGSRKESTMENLRLTGTPRDWFAFIITGDMVKYAKPDPYIYTLCCSRQGILPQDALVLEDSVNGVLAGSSAGIPTFFVPDLQKETHKADGLYARKFQDLTEVEKYLRQYIL